MANTFVLSNDNLNRYGYRVKTDGILLKNFEKNPVLFYNHNSYQMPIGRWENLRVLNGQLLGDAVFDENDEVALQVKSKVEQGILSAASIGYRVLELSEEDVVNGQTRPTVTKSEITEASIVAIPGNASALKLEFPSRCLTLSGDYDESHLDSVLPLLSLNQEKPAEQVPQAGQKPQAASTPPAVDYKLKYERAIEAYLELAKKTGVLHAENDKTVRRLALLDIELATDFMALQPVAKEEKKEDRLSMLIAERQLGGETLQKKETPKQEFLTFEARLADIKKNTNKR